MKHVRFYLEHNSPQDKRKNKHNGNVFAAFLSENGRFQYTGSYLIEGIGSVYDYPNSPVAGTAASPSFLQKQCKRIKESLAREIHPALFKILDGQNDQTKEESFLPQSPFLH